MADLTEKFPFGAIQPYEVELITELLGGQPLTDTAPARNFLTRHAEPTFPRRLLFLLPVIGRKCAEATGSDPVMGRKAFTSGALLYGGVFTTITRIPIVPCLLEVFHEVVEDPPRIFAEEEGSFNDKMLAIQSRDILRSERGDFCGLMLSAREALGVNNDDAMDLALSGAGLIHTLASQTILRSPAVPAFETAHPELSDMNDLFAEILREATNNNTTNTNE